MPSNVEIKAKARDFKSLRENAGKLAGGEGVLIKQCDTFFKCNSGRLKLREIEDQPSQLIHYQRADATGPKISDYSITTITDAAGLKDILSKAFGVRVVVKKDRWLYLVGQTRVHCDAVESLGHFMELEVVLKPGQNIKEGEAIARDLMEKLDIRDCDLLDAAYVDLILKGDS